MSKKVISLLLAIMLTVSMVAVAAVSVSAEVDEEGRYVPSEGTETYRYYFYMPSDWKNEFASTAGIYWWDGSEAPSAWPGYLAQPAEVEGVYYCDVPANVTTIIWNNAFDGGEDVNSLTYSKSCQTADIGSVCYDAGENDNYPDGTPNYDNMIYVVNPDYVNVNAGGKTTCVGEWYYYYGNGEYGFQPTRDEAVAASGLMNTEYQPPKTDVVETTVAEETTVPVTEDVTTATEDVTEEDTTPLEGPALEISATSNYFPEASAEYIAETKEVVVTYYLKSSKNVLDTQWYLTYDSDILSVSDKNTPETICPSIGANAVLNLSKPGVVKYNATSLNLFNFAEESAFAQIIFDVKDLDPDTITGTTIDLMVDVLRVSKVTEESGFMSDSDEEVLLVNNTEVLSNVSTATVAVDRRTELTPSTYVAPTTAEPTTEATVVPETTESETIAPEYPNLIVNAVSNYFPETTAEYNADTNEVTVTYWFESAKDVLDTQWYLTYDPAVLTLSENNTPETICPTIGTSAVVNTDKAGLIKYNATNLYLFNFSSQETPFAQVVFDVNDIADMAPVTTTIDLTVEVLRVSEEADNMMTDENEEVLLVDNSVVSMADEALAVVESKRTTLTPSTYVSPTTAEPTTAEPTTTEEPTTIEPTTVEPTTAEPTTVEPTTVEPTTVEPTTVQPTTAESTTAQPTTVEPTTMPVSPIEPTTADATTTTEATEPTEVTVPTEDSTDATSATDAETTVQATTKVSTGDTASNGSNNAAVQTGDASLAVIILSILIAATGVMFVLRKREMF